MQKHNFPVHLEIESTNRCNMNCVMCPRRKMTRPQGDMEYDLLKRIVDEARGKTKTCYLHQIGEPLLHPRIIDFINYTADGGIRTSISTNCKLLDKPMSERLVKSKLHELYLCLDGMSKETYEKIRVGGEFLTVIGNIIQFLDIRRKAGRGPEIVLQLIRTKDNAAEVDRFKSCYATMVRGVGKLLVKQYSTFAGEVTDMSPEPTPPRRFSCAYPFSHATIHWNGDVCLCCRDYNGITKIGNLSNSSILALWASPAYDKYRELFLNKDFDSIPLCRNC